MIYSHCCVTVTYEDMQNELFLRRALRQIVKIWISPILTSDEISTSVAAAVRLTPPKKKVTESIYPSGNRFSAAHYMILSVAPPRE